MAKYFLCCVLHLQCPKSTNYSIALSWNSTTCMTSSIETTTFLVKVPWLIMGYKLPDKAEKKIPYCHGNVIAATVLVWPWNRIFGAILDRLRPFLVQQRHTQSSAPAACLPQHVLKFLLLCGWHLWNAHAATQDCMELPCKSLAFLLNCFIEKVIIQVFSPLTAKSVKQ